MVIKVINKINTRWFDLGVLFRCPFLARSVNGANQQLKTTNGVAIESDAKTNESLCQEEDQWLESKKNEKRVKIALCDITVAHNLFLGAIKAVMVVPIAIKTKVIIIIKIKATPPTLVLLLFTQRLSQV